MRGTVLGGATDVTVEGRGRVVGGAGEAEALCAVEADVVQIGNRWSTTR